MGYRAPARTDDLEERVGVRSVQLQLCRELGLKKVAHQDRAGQLKVKFRTWANNSTCTVAPAPYHHGPEIPYLYATALDWSC